MTQPRVDFEGRPIQATEFDGPLGSEGWWPRNIDPKTVGEYKWVKTGEGTWMPDRKAGETAADIPPGETPYGEPIYENVFVPYSPAELVEYAQKGGFGPEVAAKVRRLFSKEVEAEEPRVIGREGQKYLWSPSTGALKEIEGADEGGNEPRVLEFEGERFVFVPKTGQLSRLGDDEEVASFDSLVVRAIA